MEQYIPKSALVAEIENRIKSMEECFNGKFPMSQSVKETEQDKGKLVAYKSILSSINAINVKEVDLEHLEQEVKDFCYKFDDRKDKWYDMTPHDKNIMISPTWSNFAMQLAKHFFVLGMQVCNNA